MRYLCLALVLFATPAAATENTAWECGKPRHLGGNNPPVSIYGQYLWPSRLVDSNRRPLRPS